MRYSKAQMKIQQMAFMLVALMIFFGMVAIVYFTITFSNLRDKADDLREQEAKEIARQMSATPELTFSKKGSSCSACIDLDKAYVLAKTQSYPTKYWNLDYLAIERIYPAPTKENCVSPTSDNYPDCRFLTIIDKHPGSYDGTETSPIAVVWWDESLGSDGDYRFALGRIHALAHDPTK